MSQLTKFPDDLFMSEFGYHLPEEKIARHPSGKREQSKLLVWKSGIISESTYDHLGEFLPDYSLLTFNNSRVVEARILFQKPGGGQIEIFCLEPYPSDIHLSLAMTQTGKVLWTCLIGGASKWKRGQILTKEKADVRLEARFIEKRKDDFIVELSWTPSSFTFAEILHVCGSIPLPPYLKRSAEPEDIERYQTVYAREAGSVAAPTAGLHFSEDLLRSLTSKGIQSLFLTLHVGAGTFMPVKTEKLSEHIMHEEFIEVDAATLENLILKINEPVIAVGTTSLRTLESLYWLGLKVNSGENSDASCVILDQWYSYQQPAELSPKESLEVLLDWIKKQPGGKLIARTKLFIVPGYQFKIVKGLITNFHQPHSTLLLLVAALIGADWKNAYTYALDHDFRFLSYGDGCLFLPE